MLERLKRLRHRDLLVDAAVVLVVLALLLVQFSTRDFVDDGVVATDADWLGFVLILVTALPLFWRRRYPWAAMAIAGAGNIALVACGYLVHVPVALMVALYTLAADLGGGRAWPPIAFATFIFAAQVAVEIAVISLSLEDYVIPALLLAGAWVFGEHRRTASLRRAEELERRERDERLSIAEERTRIARELHDSAGHAINTILVQAGAARVLRERDPAASREAIEAIERLARETIEDIDRIVGSLRADDGPAERAPLPGIERIPDLIADLRRAGLDVELREQTDDWRMPPPAVDRAAYRIAQEALTNAARHGSGRADLTLHHHVDRLELTVVNPTAATPAPPRSAGGFGLVGMRERAQMLGGSFEAGAEDGRFRVRAVFPYGWVRGERES